jgi:hypothetical protein
MFPTDPDLLIVDGCTEVRQMENTYAVIRTGALRVSLVMSFGGHSACLRTLQEQP